MKKNFLIVAATVSAVLFNAKDVNAQNFSEAVAYRSAPAEFYTAVNLLTSDHADKLMAPVEVNTRALKNFRRDYKNAVNEDWTSLVSGGSKAEGGYVCRFTLNDVTERAFYDNKGNWKFTIAGYADEKLAGEIHSIVKSTYYDYAITYVHEVDFPDGSKVYLVQVRDKDSYKIVRVSDGQLELVEDYKANM
ncbi:MAG: hypothetical protein C5B59_19070 [Bacteroidetes bacterium]|nr:MAG: hypothetical protein C5B59_19070 [Bacteroidota bacterium]